MLPTTDYIEPLSIQQLKALLYTLCFKMYCKQYIHVYSSVKQVCNEY